MDKKNIDELFREKFKAFREVPDIKVWTAIENSLDRKQKKSIIPLWWKLGGVAAVLAIALTVLYPLGNSIEKNAEVTDTDNTEGNYGNEKKLDIDTKEGQENVLQIPEATEDAVAKSSKDGKIKPTEQNSNLNVNKASISDNPEIEGLTDNTTEPRTEKVKKGSKKQYPRKTQLTINEPGKIRENEEKNKEDAVKAQNGSTIKNSDGIVTKKENTEIPLGQSVDKVVKNNTAAKDNTDDGHKKSIFEAFEEQAGEEKIAEDSGGRWSAGPSVAPVYFNALGEGSPIDPGFSSNTKAGSTNLSYGLSVAYALTRKLSLRSGIHKAEYGYDTKNVGFSPTLAASLSGGLQNIKYPSGPENLAVNGAVSDLEFSYNSSPEFNGLNSTRNGSVAQQFGYLEIPLELDYALIDRRFGVNLIGGVSSLFLIDNSVTLSSGELTAEIGEARNLNGLNFSTNIGFGVNYKFTPKVQLNIEPVFKYQLNTFSNTSGDFRPYSVGVYSGLNFRF